MITLQLNYETGDTHTLHLDFPVKIGREHASDVVISHWRVSKCHCQLLQLQDQCFVEDQGSLLGTLLNGRRVMGRQLLNKGDQLIIGPCLIQVLDVSLDEPAHEELDSSDLTEIPLIKQEVLCPKSAIPLSEPNTEYHVSHISSPHSHVDDGALLVLRKRLSASLKQTTDLRRKNLSHVSNDVLREEMGEVLVGLIESDQMARQYPDRDALVQTVLDEILGLGVLEPLLADEEVSEIMVNRYDQIYIEKAGRIYPTVCKFTSEEALREVVNRIVSPLGRRIDESSPMVDGRLNDGSRMNAVIPPIALHGTNLTIRKFKHKKLNIEDLIAFGALDQYMARFLQYCVKHKKNIIVSGGTGSGKTTLLNILSNFIPEDERLITIEDSAELKLKHQ
ncbi:MAG: ATPase, T2SS/T4P/T4SS family, partial [Alcaligenaceae bacterium]|nr:ATPase, T2SS/T4P/T4SS family [Alcaligenaceae bacterium]